MKVSVIICTRNRAHAITNCLNSIDQALRDAAPLEAEIVVVDNGSTDETSEFIKKWSGTCTFPVNVVLETKAGLSNARNAGIQAARGALLVFTDDDCIMATDYINKAIAYDAADKTPALRGGRVELGDPSDLPISIKLNPEARTWSKELNSARFHNIGDALIGANMTMRKVIAEKVGLFDARLGAGTNLPGGEETDYIYRTYLSGFPITYVPDMVVHHFHGRKLKAEGSKLYKNYAIGNGALYMKYLFRYPYLCIPFYVEFKHAVREILGMRNPPMPDIAFTYTDMIICHIKGAMLFLCTIRPLGKNPVKS